MRIIPLAAVPSLRIVYQIILKLLIKIQHKNHLSKEIYFARQFYLLLHTIPPLRSELSALFPLFLARRVFQTFYSVGALGVNFMGTQNLSI